MLRKTIFSAIYEATAEFDAQEAETLLVGVWTNFLELFKHFILILVGGLPRQVPHNDGRLFRNHQIRPHWFT